MTDNATFISPMPEKDPRCPHCGRAVLGAFIQGAEGRYHPACTQPPMDLRPLPVYPQPYTPPWWYPPTWPGPTITWTTASNQLKFQ
jgi:hypothetical protein